MITPAEQLDRRFAEVRVSLKWMVPPAHGWIRAIRQALGMTTTQLAQRMDVTQPRIHELERAELNRGVTLKSLDRAAAAMGCRVVYMFVPEKPLEEILAGQADAVADQRLQQIEQTMRLEDQAVKDPARRRELKRDL